MPLVVDPVMVASSGARLLEEDAVETLVARLFPLATVVTPNLARPRASSGPARSASSRSGCTSWVRRRSSSPAGTAAGRPSLRRRRGTSDPGRAPRGRGHARRRLYAFGDAGGPARSRRAARGGGARRSEAASRAVAQGHPELGAGEGPVDVLGLGARRERRRRDSPRSASAGRSSTRSRTSSS